MAQALYGPSWAPRSQIQRQRCSLVCRAEAPLPSDNSVKQLSKEQMLAKIAAAKEYKTKPQSVSPSASAPPTHPPPSPPPAAEQKEDANVLAAFDAYAVRQAEGEAADFLQAQQALEASKPPKPPPPPPSPPSDKNEDLRAFRKGSGNADQAANWLQTVATQGLANGLDTNMRMEEFTAKKEALQREKGASIEIAKGIVTGTRRKLEELDDYGLAKQQDEAEASMAAERAEIAAAKAAAARAEAAAAGLLPPEELAESQENEEEQQEDVHKPKVATWGVFPRPRNISEAYGGGRNLRPGQALESEEAAAARQQRVSAALSSYKKSMGLEIDPAVEAEAISLYEEGEKLFKAGRITAALEKFSASVELVPLRSKIGGQAALQKAICLDSLGRNQDAYNIYKSLEGHNGPGVSKAAKRFLFGFKAAQKLKVDTMYYGSGGAQAWQSYFDRINSSGWTEYRAKEEESEEDKASARTAAVVAMAVVLVPLAFTAAIIVK